jgi:transcription elongation factor GreA
MLDRIPISREGYNKIKAEIDHLEHVELARAADRVAAARAEGDLNENAEYHGARETLGMLQAKIHLLKDKLARATIVDPSTVPQDVVNFGAIVTVRDLDGSDEEEFQLVGPGEEDYDSGKILLASPIGQGLLGKRVGDHAEIAVPKGTLRFEIVAIRYE